VAINFRSNTIISNLRIGPLSGGGGGGGGYSEPSYLVVGATGATSAGISNGGIAYIYNTSDYTAAPLQLTPTPASLSNSPNFGYRSTSTVTHTAISAYYEEGKGAVYIYDSTDFTATPTKVMAYDGAGGDTFGEAIALNSNFLAVGASGNGSNDRGAVYVYDLSNLSAAPTKLVMPDYSSFDYYFGRSVALNSSQLIIGADYESNARGRYAGSVYVYDVNNLLASPTKLTAFDGQANDIFGVPVVASDDYIIVGAPESDDGIGNNSGAVYVFDANNLSATSTKLAPSDRSASDYFGRALSISGNTLLVAAPNNDDIANNTGTVYVYDAGDLSASPTKIYANDATANDEFGWSVNILGNNIVVGAKSNDELATDAGAVYIYDRGNLSAAPTKIIVSDDGSTDYRSNSFGFSVSFVP
jgi:hypothetical protein